MEILFLGGLFPKETETEIINNSIGSVQNAANNLQWEFAKGLEENSNKSITILNSLYIGSYPKRYKKMRIKTYNFSRNLDNSKATNVGFINLTGIKIVSRYLSLKPFVKDWINSKKDSKKIIIAYAMTSTFTQIFEYAKKADNSIATCLIIPDLPQYMNLSNQKKILYKLLENLEIKIIKKNMEYIDSYVVLTQHMLEVLEVSKPYVVIEGISTDIFNFTYKDSDSDYNQDNLKTVLYTGGLNEKYGVVNLIRSFEMLENENYRLIICGSGDAEKTIREASERDSRIIFKGLLKREEILKLQKNATVLINPRANNEEYTKYSFPSKILEYMSSGTPVLAYMLDGMPNEYRDYIYKINDNEENAIYYALKGVLEKKEEELFDKGKKAKEFVLHEKNRKRQCKKILDMLSNII
jgi:glycosyltransferase involved in cell wall biosynthesis